MNSLDRFRFWLQQDWSTLKTATIMSVGFFVFFAPAIAYNEIVPIADQSALIEGLLAGLGLAGNAIAFIWLIKVGEKGNPGPKK